MGLSQIPMHIAPLGCCVRRHILTVDNVFYDKGGTKMVCKECEAIRGLRKRLKKGLQVTFNLNEIEGVEW